MQASKTAITGAARRLLIDMGILLVLRSLFPQLPSGPVVGNRRKVLMSLRG